MAVQPNSYRGFRVTRGDATGAQLAILVPDTYRVLHFASGADFDTDWNVANPTHPTFYVHSETTPATDYGRFAHDSTDLVITSVGGGIRLVPVGDVQVDDTFGLIIGGSSQVTVSDGDGATNLIPEMQVLGTAAADGSLVVATFNTTNDRTVSPHIVLLKGAAATQVATTAVADNEVVGSIIAYGSDSGDFETPVAAIEFVVDDVGGPGASAIGGSLEFYTTADGGTTLTIALTLSNAQLATFAGGIQGNTRADIGITGTTTGIVAIDGATTGTVTLTVAAAAGTWTMTLPITAGTNGYSLTTDGNGATTWTNIASVREAKDILPQELWLTPQDALDKILHTVVPAWKYKKGYGTGDTETVYHGPIADEAPWAMHYDGGVLNPVNTFGVTALAIQALDHRITLLEPRRRK